MPIEPPKVGYVLKRYPRFSETFVVNEILAHEAAGWNLEIFALGPVEETHFQDAIAHVRAPVTRLIRPERSGAGWSMLMRAAQRFPGAVEALAAQGASHGDGMQALALACEARERGVTHLHAHFGTQAASVTRLAARIAGLSWSFTAHAKDIYHDYAEPVRLNLKMREADATITVSDYNLAHLRTLAGRDADRTIRIYNGLDLSRFDHMPPGSDAREILAVGRLVEKKGFHILLEALLVMKERGRPHPCRIIGSGEEEAALREQIAASGLEDIVTLAGPMAQSDVIAAMRGAAVLACPCVVGRDGNRDGLPTVVLEAMALGLPVVSSDVTGLPEIVRDGQTGLCVPEGDPLALADALGRMVGNDDLRMSVSSAARRLIEAEFDIDRNAARLREVFLGAAAPRLEGVA
ncbi:glycosyltransferase family 4 protein [Jannaschia aquimarina]|uniref:KanE_2 protein n=1 Tax=Jannaschia aquimarina TaxID=935700 RepID=A0A0D1CQ41_9RHOB|nr:glycosyltransferase family 4 protein [Jannaschia aquimarina]KIT16852.1 Alpha-D-kanosaminyltransferase [Jannaschia aquimarina]SNT13018.1 Glycosyltransferase involved in cell wall bisynthesis [Jannaschia aquimarina]